MKNNRTEFISDREDTLLKFVRAELEGTPSGKIKSYLEHRQISVNGIVTTKYNYPVHKGQSVVINAASTKGIDDSLEIIYEDEWLIAINKPAGLLSVASDSQKEKTAFRMMKQGREGEIFVVHRLDKDTSGVLLFAKSKEIRDRLQSDWDKVAKREYLAVCDGVFEQKSGRCDTLLAENVLHMVYSSTKGKRAITNYVVTKENEKYSFLKINIETGRKNQIRVHMSELGHPVTGDKKYGGSRSPIGRMYLHAALLSLPHPATGKTLVLRAKPPRKFTLPSKEV